MKPVRDPAHLAFIRSLPCCVCFRTRNVEAAHVGRRGMGQKCSDRETMPLCSLHHREQHRIGLKQFARDYELDIPALVAALTEKPRIKLASFPLRSEPTQTVRVFVAHYRNECFTLFSPANGIDESIELAKMLCREYLIEQLFSPEASERERRNSPPV